jgi:hypothetical protein
MTRPISPHTQAFAESVCRLVQLGDHDSQEILKKQQLSFASENKEAEFEIKQLIANYLLDPTNIEMQKSTICKIKGFLQQPPFP